MKLVELIQARTQIARREKQLLTTRNRKTVGDGTILRLLHTQRLKIEVAMQKELNEIEDESKREELVNLLNNSPASVLKFYK